MSNSNLYSFRNDANTSIASREVVITSIDGTDVNLGWIAKVGNLTPSTIHAEESDALRQAVLIYIDTQEIPLHKL